MAFQPKQHPWIAAVLSFFLPGLGQVFNGYILRGVLWFVAVGIGYWMLIIPGVVLHATCVIMAFMETRR
jgi:TM2 domain-containing membrane protein YozV